MQFRRFYSLDFYYVKEVAKAMEIFLIKIQYLKCKHLQTEHQEFPVLLELR